MTNFKSRKLLYVIEFYIVICVALCQGQCQQKCWHALPNTQMLSGSEVPDAGTENDCKVLCANSETCVGVDWMPSTHYSCWIQMTSTNNSYNTTSDVKHWNLVNCSDGGLSYCWKPLEEDYHIYGGQYVGITDETTCKSLCSRITSCTGVDWVAGANKCFLINFNGKITAQQGNGVRHWDIVRNISADCQIAEIQTDNPAITNPSRTPFPAAVSASTTSAGQTDATGKIQYSVVIALAVLSGVLLVVIVVLAVVLFRTTRLQRGQNSSFKVKEPEEAYNSLELDIRSQDPDYTDLQPTN